MTKSELLQELTKMRDGFRVLSERYGPNNKWERSQAYSVVVATMGRLIERAGGGD